MAADDRELRDRLEQLQVETKVLRARLDDPNRLDVVRAETKAELAQLEAAHVDALAKLERVKADAEDARMRSMESKRERSEGSVLAHVDTSARVVAAITGAVGAAAAGVAYGEFLHLGLPALALCGAGAAGFLALIYRIARALRDQPPLPS